MQFAIRDGDRIRANKKERAKCPSCGQIVVAKCGDLIRWHWAHERVDECDSFSDGETLWHIDWKSRFPEDCQEVVVENHRADIKIGMWVVEFQNSSINVAEIKEREDFYKTMTWVLNGTEFFKNFELRKREQYGKEWFSFHWNWVRKCWLVSKSTIFVDTGESLFEIKQLHQEGHGWGLFCSYDEFVSRVLSASGMQGIASDTGFLRRCTHFGCNWTDRPHEKRPGWISTTCDRCGKWIGNRPESAA